MSKRTSTSLFLFAHQDDEFGVYNKITEDVRNGNLVYCAYLTTGTSSNLSSTRRNNESISVLTSLGVKKQNIFFAGDILGIADSELHKSLSKAKEWIKEWVNGYPKINSIYIPAWEGGHHDHDILHAIMTVISHQGGYISLVRQFPLYNSSGSSGPLFNVLLPLRDNGPVEATRILLFDRLKHLVYCFRYPSQLRSWVGLFPFVLLYYLTVGEQRLQSVSFARLKNKPHGGKLFYEKRNRFTWNDMVKLISQI